MLTDAIEITAFIRLDTERAIAIWDGSCDDQGTELWTWLPKSQIEVHGRSRDVRIRLPEWLARDRDLATKVGELQVENARLKGHVARLEARLAQVEQHIGLDRTRH